jgi:hypothetical protein
MVISLRDRTIQAYFPDKWFNDSAIDYLCCIVYAILNHKMLYCVKECPYMFGIGSAELIMQN